MLLFANLSSPVQKRETDPYSRAAFRGRVYFGPTFQKRGAFFDGAEAEAALAVAPEAVAVVLDVASGLLRGDIKPDRYVVAVRVLDRVADGLAQDQVQLQIGRAS